MKKFLPLTIFFVLLFTGILLSQWSTDPNNTLVVGYGLDPHICSDNADGCYITYDYDNIYYPRKLGLEKLDRYGYKPWVTLKQILGEFPQQYKAQIVEDGEGGVIVSYTDEYENSPSYIYNVRVQRIDSSGNFLWGPLGVRVTLEGINNSQQKIVADGSGGAVVEWINHLAEYKINRISSEGERMWGDSGIVLGTNGYFDPVELIRTTNNKYVANAERNVYKFIDENGNIFCTINVTLGYIIPDNEGGIILSGRVWTGMIPKLVAQRKDSLGNDLWQEPYVEIADSLYINTQLSIKYNDGYYYYGWAGNKNGIAKVAQFQALRADGSILFPEGSIKIGDPPLNGTIVQPLETNRTAFIYYNSDLQPDTLLIQAYDTVGNKLWDENGVVISHPPISSQSYTSDGNGGFIIGGTINEFTIVAQQVNKFGVLGEVIIPVELISFTAEEVSSIVKLRWITATETNNHGFEVQRSVGLRSEAGSQKSDWEKIGFVEGNGTATDPKSYSFVDNLNPTLALPHTLFYRLKQIDFDGTFKYSKEVEVNLNPPLEFSLSQNYPNPFNPITNINYQIPVKSFVTLKIYNTLGQEVITLVNEEKPAGSYEVKFSAKVSSGVYIYRLTAGNYSDSKKLILLK